MIILASRIIINVIHMYHSNHHSRSPGQNPVLVSQAICIFPRGVHALGKGEEEGKEKYVW